jgi:formylglycine-generating enzyme required for sulfatase activity
MVMFSREAPVAFSVLQQLTAGLAAIGDERGLLERMRLRRTAAGDLDASSAAAWQRVLGALGEEREVRYAGVVPNPRLVPLGRDPRSGLEEFLVRGTGSRPKRGPDGSLIRARDFGVVVVLLPAGTFVRGSISGYETRAGPQPPPKDEGPLSVVSVRPMYLSKYELTQAQWERMTEGDRPSHERAGRPRPGHGATPGRGTISQDDPVGQISWTRSRDILGRFGLRLPTEAEWEHAAWGGTCAPTLPRDADQAALQAFLEARFRSPPGFWRYVQPGDDAAAYANFADATFAKAAPHDLELATDFDDGHHFHAWVGAFKPNDYGLHDMHGNVNEWVRDILDGVYYEYSRRFDPPGSGAEYEPVERVYKGGSWGDLPRNLQISDRRGGHPEVGRRTVGVRPAMSLTPFRVEAGADR